MSGGYQACSASVDYVFVVVGGIVVRSGPSTETEKLGKLEHGTIIRAQAPPDDDWVPIDYAGTAGFVRKGKRCRSAAELVAKQELYFVNRGLTCRKEASKEADKIGTFAHGNAVIATGSVVNIDDSSWVPTEIQSKPGFVCQGKYCRRADDDDLYVVTDHISVREGPGSDEAKLGRLAAGELVVATGKLRNHVWIPIDFHGSPAFVAEGKHCAKLKDDLGSFVAQGSINVTSAVPNYQELLSMRGDPKPGHVRGEAKVIHQIRYKKSCEEEPKPAFDLEAWKPLPPDLGVIKEWLPREPDEFQVDAYGCNIGYWKICNINEELELGYKVTINHKTKRWDILDIPAQEWISRANPPGTAGIFTEETDCIDYKDKAIQDAVSDLSLDTGIIQLVAEIYQLTNVNLTANGPTPSQTKASFYWKEKEGRCYAHALVFLALCRGVGLPARAAAGMLLKHQHNGIHTWCQVFLPTAESPDGQWVDMDARQDDADENDAHEDMISGASFKAFDHFAQLHPSQFAWYHGSFDKKSRKDGRYVERTWLGTVKMSGPADELDVLENKRSAIFYSD